MDKANVNEDDGFHCCASSCKFGVKEAVKAGLRLGKPGFVGKCPICHQETIFLTYPEPTAMALKYIEDFGEPIPKACPSNKEHHRIKRHGLNFACGDCNAIFSS